MSDPPPSSAEITALTAAVRELTLALQSPEPRVVELPTPPGHWEFVGTEIEDYRFAADLECRIAAQRNADEGPGDTPQILVEHATTKLTGKSPGPVPRARRAFTAGFWAQIAVATSTQYQVAPPLANLKAYYWVVLKCPAFEGTGLFKARADFGRAIEDDVGGSVFEAFSSLTEVEIFCCAARVPVPRLVSWKRRRSDVLQTVSQASSSGAHQQI